MYVPLSFARRRNKLITPSLPPPSLNYRFVIPELKVAPSADKPAEGLGCYTIGDAANKVALLMCEGVNSDFTPAAKGKYRSTVVCYPRKYVVPV